MAATVVNGRNLTFCKKWANGKRWLSVRSFESLRVFRSMLSTALKGVFLLESDLPITMKAVGLPEPRPQSSGAGFFLLSL